ncbi:hypothetical protein [Microbispora rosea]
MSAPASAAAVVVPAPPWWTTAATRGNSACWSTSSTGRQSGPSSAGDRPAQPRSTITRRPSARAAATVVRAMSRGARTLPKPTQTGGSPSSRNLSSSGGSGRRSGRIQAPVCTTPMSAGSGQGPSVGSAASQGRSVNRCPRMSATGARPAAARWALIAAPTVPFQRRASSAHSARLPAVASAGACPQTGTGACPQTGTGAWCGDGSVTGQ